MQVFRRDLYAEGATPVPVYLSMHIIACMTRQGLNQLIATMQAAQEIRFIRACASQMAGRLLCEFEAADQDALLRFLDEHHIAHEWIIRVELTWGEPTAASTPATEGSGSAPPQTSSRQDVAAQRQTPVTAEARAEASPMEQPREQASPSTPAPSEASEAAILHILRTLRDESAWQMIRAQHGLQPVAVLLMHDAVLVPPPLDVPIYACEADVTARGITSPLPRLTYDQIVDLIFACKRVMVW